MLFKIPSSLLKSIVVTWATQKVTMDVKIDCEQEKKKTHIFPIRLCWAALVKIINR